MTIFKTNKKKNHWATPIKILLGIMIGVGLLLLPPDRSWAGAEEPLRYQLRFNPQAPYQAQVTVDTSALNSFELLPARSMLQGKKITPLIFCDGQKVGRADKPLALKCKQISWELNFKKLLPGGLNATHQDNLFIAKPQPWWLFYEWDNFPRIADQEILSQVCAQIVNTPIGPGAVETSDLNQPKIRCRPLPTTQQPPLIMPVGPPRSQYKSAHLSVNLFGQFDQKQAQNLLKQYAEINGYLAKIIPSKKNEISWDLIWMPVDKSVGSLGGAAGHHSFVANYPVEQGQWTDQSEQWLLRISAHETVHALSKLKMPIWAGESLAEYYAFKGINNLGLKVPSPQTDLEQRAAKTPHINRGLYYASEQVSRHKKMSFYPLLYVKGAAFWYEVDMKLQENQGENLDNYLKLLEGWADNENELPKQFESALVAALSSPVWDEIKKQYLLRHIKVTDDNQRRYLPKSSGSPSPLQRQSGHDL